MQEKLLIPKVDPPKWDTSNGKRVIEARILEDSSEEFTIQIKSTTDQKRKEILHIPIPKEYIPSWEKAPILIIPTKDMKRMEITSPQREVTYHLTYDLEAPLEPIQARELQAMEMNAGALEHCIGIREGFTEASMKSCVEEAAKDKKIGAVEVIKKIEEIVQEYIQEGTTWEKKSEAFENSQNLDWLPGKPSKPG